MEHLAGAAQITGKLSMAGNQNPQSPFSSPADQDSCASKEPIIQLWPPSTQVQGLGPPLKAEFEEHINLCSVYLFVHSFIHSAFAEPLFCTGT